MKQFMVALFVLAAFFGGLAWFLFRDVARMGSWPSVTGTIDSAVISTEIQDSATRTRHLYQIPRIEYSFTVDGRAYIGRGLSNEVVREQIDSVDAPASGSVKKALERYAAGTTVMVRYNPKNPDHAVLEVHATGAYVCAALAGAFLLGAVAAAFAG